MEPLTSLPRLLGCGFGVLCVASAALLGARSCIGQTPIAGPQRPPSAGSLSQPAALAATAPARFLPASIMDDPQHIGGSAFSILAPEGWRVAGRVVWSTDASNPAQPWVRLFGPSSQEMAALPGLVFVWNPGIAGYFPPGSFYCGTEVQQPVADPFQCIRRIVLPRYERQLASARVVSQAALPEMAAAARLKYPQPEYHRAAFRAGKIRFAYVENGVEMEEDVYVVTLAVSFPVGPYRATAWSPDEIRYFRGPRGTLDAQEPLFRSTMFSLRPDIRWWAKLERVQAAMVEELKRQSAATANAALSRLAQEQRVASTAQSVARSGDQINDMIMKGYQRRMATLDRVHQEADRTVRQVQVMYDPMHDKMVELPASNDRMWAIKGGGYLRSNTDPNQQYGPGYATELQPAKP